MSENDSGNIVTRAPEEPLLVALRREIERAHAFVESDIAEAMALQRYDYLDRLCVIEHEGRLAVGSYLVTPIHWSAADV